MEDYIKGELTCLLLLCIVAIIDSTHEYHVVHYKIIKSCCWLATASLGLITLHRRTLQQIFW